MNDFWTGFFSNFFSDLLVGAGFGFFLAWRLNKMQQKEAEMAERRKTEQEQSLRKKKILELIHGELEANQKILHEISSEQDQMAVFDECFAIAHRMKYELWAAFSDGGELQWINNVGLVDTLAQAYYSIKAVLFAGRSYLQSHYFEVPSYGPVVAEHIGKSLNDNIALAKYDINLALGLIENYQPTLRRDYRNKESV